MSRQKVGSARVRWNIGISQWSFICRKATCQLSAAFAQIDHKCNPMIMSRKRPGVGQPQFGRVWLCFVTVGKLWIYHNTTATKQQSKYWQVSAEECRRRFVSELGNSHSFLRCTRYNPHWQSLEGKTIIIGKYYANILDWYNDDWKKIPVKLE